MTRGDGREMIYHDDADQQRFLETVAEVQSHQPAAQALRDLFSGCYKSVIGDGSGSGSRQKSSLRNRGRVIKACIGRIKQKYEAAVTIR